MLAELATFSLILALSMSLLAAASLARAGLRVLLPAASSLTALLVFVAFVLLIILRIDSDFTVANVASHSNRALPLLYKIAGAWGNHEGSMLLWALVVSLFGAILANSSPIRGDGLYQHAASIQAMLTAGVLGFILAASNPFARLFPPPADGKMLNPLLQDIALSFHPPMLYLGYVGFSAVFSLVIAGLLTKKIDSEWAEAAHPWIMAAWAALTAGITLGSWWAYRELGWGGFWFWDPVENASLLPWLAGTALLHANVVLKKRGLLASWVALLAILTFGLSLIGTFLVRSGVITSVHSFASDPARGLYILGYIALSIGGGLWLYGTRIKAIAETAPLRPASREGIIVINNLFVLTACATVFIGTLYPLISEAMGGDTMTIGAPYFNATFLPLMVIPLFFAGLAPFLAWKKANLRAALRRTWPALAATWVSFVVVLAYIKQETLLAACGFVLATFLAVASAGWLAAGKWRMRSNWPVFLGHFGAALLVVGITGVGLWSAQVERMVAMEDSVQIAGYSITAKAQEMLDEANYTGTRLALVLSKNGKDITALAPEFRQYKNQSTTSETAIYSTPGYDIYTVIGETDADGKTALRVYFRPSISFIWLGAAIIALGGLLGVFSKRRA